MSCQLLHRIDPNLNMARFYRVELTPDRSRPSSWCNFPDGLRA